MIRKDYASLGEVRYWERCPNGLTVNVIRRPGYAKKYAFFATRYGSVDMRFALDGVWHETPAGVAHYLEHKMFDTKEGNALQELSQNGAEPNAFTANAMTAYYFDCTEKFEENLRILLSFVSVPYFTEESVAKEQGIIGQEIRMVEDNPDWQVYSNLFKGLYRFHPARVPVVGTIESISHITAQTLYNCHKAFYDPSNMTLCVVGDVDPERVAAIANEILPASSGVSIERDYGATESAEAEAPSVETTMEVALPQFLCGYKCAPVTAGEDYLRGELLGQLACDVLFGESSPLYARMYSEGLINGEFGGGYEILPNLSYVAVGGESQSPRRVHLAIAEEAERLARAGVDDGLYQQCRRAAYGASIRALNSFSAIAGAMADGEFYQYDPLAFQQAYDHISKQDVQHFITEYFIPERATISIIHPKAES